MQVGYCRVSSTDQRLDLQIDALQKAGCERIFTDTISGTKADRPGLREALGYCRRGDTLSVWRLDRLGRSLPDLLRIVGELERQGVGFRSLTESIDTATVGGKLAFSIFGAVGQFEVAVLRQRTLEGMKAAALRGRHGGRPRSMTTDKIDAARKLLAAGTAPREVAKLMGVSTPTLYRHCPAQQVSPPAAQEAA
jgi:DNA invertase Pin-like site-specific DNA recombinase